jgi:hypothetical protein
MIKSTRDPNRIVLRQETRVLETGEFAEAISPGMILDYSDGDTSTFVAHPDAGESAKPVRVAEINYLLGETTSDDYEADDHGPVAFLRAGDLFMGLLASGTDYSDGDKLVSAGDGTLKQMSSEDEGALVGILKEDKDLSAQGAVDTLARVEVA